MVKAGRVACIFTPFALCLASLICMIIIFLGGQYATSTTLGSYYWFKVDLTGVTGIDIVPGTDLDQDILEALKDANDVQDFYTIYLQNYCAWNDDEEEYSFCSGREAQFAFDPIEVWGLRQNGLEEQVPQDLKDGVKIYKTVSEWMFIGYVIALVALVLEILVGISAIFSRWGSLATTFCSSLATIFLIAASATSTAMYTILEAVIQEELEKYSVIGEVGKKMQLVTWLATAFSILATFFWLFSVCCCTGRSPYGKKKKTNTFKKHHSSH